MEKERDLIIDLISEGAESKVHTIILKSTMHQQNALIYDNEYTAIGISPSDFLLPQTLDSIVLRILAA